MLIYFRKICRKIYQRRKTMALIVCGLSVLCFSFLWFFNHDDHKFENYCDTLFVKELSEDALSLHYMVSDPASYGISVNSPTLPVYSYDEYVQSNNEIANCLASLSEINPDSLTNSNRITYELIDSYLTDKLAQKDYLYYDEPLSFASGMQCELPILLAEYTLRNTADIEHYLLLLQSLPAYFDGLSMFEYEKAQAGLFMSDEACDKVISQCNTLITMDSLLEHSHFLQTSFSERLKVLFDEGIISSSQKVTYESANTEILIKDVLPAYETLSNFLSTLKGSGTNDSGLYYYPDGAKYYLLLVKEQTGSDKTMEEMLTIIKEAFANDYKELIKLSSKLDASVTAAEIFSISEPEKMLSDLETQISQDFPAFPQRRSNALPSHIVKSVTKGMEDYLSPAFYLTPPLDDISENVIYINYGGSPDNLTLYTTLAHEGYPGHLYQSVYYYLTMEDSNVPPVRSLLHYGGYVEGYATYAEMLSYDYAKKFGNPTYCEIVRLNRRLHLALYSMLDISIHYCGANYEEAHTLMAAFGINDPALTREIYDYIVSEPATYLKYYIGYLEVCECKKLAKENWQEEYSDLAFHTFFLNFGPADFKTIKMAISAF